MIWLNSPTSNPSLFKNVPSQGTSFHHCRKEEENPHKPSEKKWEGQALIRKVRMSMMHVKGKRRSKKMKKELLPFEITILSLLSNSVERLLAPLLGDFDPAAFFIAWLRPWQLFLILLPHLLKTDLFLLLRPLLLIL